MTNTTQAILFGVVGLILGLVLAGYSVNSNYQPMMNMMGINQRSMIEHMSEEQMEEMMGHDGRSMSMDAMVEELEDKRGDEFDDSFTQLMIEHHQGAIDMAELAQKYAKHDEIKNLAGDIIKAQTTEIEMMSNWRTNWGY